MGKANNKTVETEASVEQFLGTIEDERRRNDSRRVIDMMQRVSGSKPRMWGLSIVGFGSYHYKYDSRREGDFLKLGFSPRKANLTFYVMPGFDLYDELLQKLGKHTTGKSCLYIKKLEDINWEVLEKLCTLSYEHMTRKYG